jgi:hypothetical protein
MDTYKQTGAGKHTCTWRPPAPESSKESIKLRRWSGGLEDYGLRLAMPLTGWERPACAQKEHVTST